MFGSTRPRALNSVRAGGSNLFRRSTCEGRSGELEGRLRRIKHRRARLKVGWGRRVMRVDTIGPEHEIAVERREHDQGPRVVLRQGANVVVLSVEHAYARAGCGP